MPSRDKQMTPKAKKIIYLSGSRADFGLMESALSRIACVADLSIAVTGMHLEPCFGNTVDEIRAGGFRVCGEIRTDVQTRTPQSMSAGIGVCLENLTRLLGHEKPDILLVLGDRGEMLAGAIAALHLGIVCVHIHGGERSGTVDEPVRHAISKLSSYHFVATAESRERLIRMGEMPEHIWVTGAPGLDNLAELQKAGGEAFWPALGISAGDAFVLAVFHPIVQQSGSAYGQTANLLSALNMTGLPVIWLQPNSDAGSLEVVGASEDISLPPGSRRIVHLTRSLFCMAMKHCAVMVGNSSSGIIEAASFGTPVVNVGDRQRMRERNANVMDVGYESEKIYDAMQAALIHGKWPCDNRYGDGLAGMRISENLLALPMDRSVLEKINTY